MASAISVWVKAARLRTLPAAVAPVLVGTSLAAREDYFEPLVLAAALMAGSSLLVVTRSWLAHRRADASGNLPPRAAATVQASL